MIDRYMQIDDFLVYFAIALFLVNSPNNIQKKAIYFKIQNPIFSCVKIKPPLEYNTSN